LRAPVFIIVTLACLVPWAWVQAQMSLNGDVVWLVQGAAAIMHGHAMTAAWYDTNPPMSALIYLPVLLLRRAGVMAEYAPTLYAGLLLALAGFLNVRFLRAWPAFGAARIAGVLAAWLLAVTLVPQYEFAQKDHLIAITLLPLLLAQFAMLRGYDAPPRRYVVLAVVLALPFILVKPHFGLLPFAMAVYRLWRVRSVREILRSDFIILGAGLLAYLAALPVFFPDFMAEILPASIKAYAGIRLSWIGPAVTGAGLLGVCLCCMAACIDDRERRAQALFLSLTAMLAVIPVWVQMKGFSVHLLPCLSLMLPAAFVVLSFYAGRLFDNRRLAVPVFVALWALGTTLFTPNTTYPTHDAYRRGDWAQMIETQGQGAFYMQADSTNIVMPLAFYTGTGFASRFPTPWFLPLVRNGDAAARARYGGYMAADLEAYKPGLVLLYAHPAPESDILALLRDDAVFARAWAAYSPAGQVTLDPAAFYPGTRFARQAPVVYDMYIRK
jgi:hypothetical protein